MAKLRKTGERWKGRGRKRPWVRDGTQGLGCSIVVQKVSEGYTELELEGAVVDFGALIAECGDEVGAVLEGEIEGLELKAYADLPTHLEALPVAILAVLGVEHAVPVAVAFEVELLAVLGNLAAGVREGVYAEVDAQVRLDVDVAGGIETVSHVDGYTKLRLRNLEVYL